MKKPNLFLLPFLLALPMAFLSLTSCEEKGPAEKAGESIDEAVEEVDDEVDDATTD